MPLDAVTTNVGAGILAFALLATMLAWGTPSARRAVFFATTTFIVSLAALAIVWLVERSGLAIPLGSIEFLAIFGIGIAVVRLVTVALFAWILPRFSSTRIVQDITTGGAYLVWTFVWLRENQVDLAGLIATSAVVTAVIAFSLQDTLGNILGGMAIQLDRSFARGDWIRLEDQVGRVVDIRWRTTAIETRNWETVLIPNSQIVKSRVLVLGRREGAPVQWRRWVWFHVDYRHAPTQVIQVVERAIRAAEIPKVAKEPAPNCLMMDFAESCARYALRYWLTDLANDDPTDSAVRAHVYFALKREGIDPYVSSLSVLVSRHEEREAEEHAHLLADRRKAVDAVDLFQTLEPEERERLATSLVPGPFAPGAVMTQMGAEGHWLYVVAAGRADVVIEDAAGTSRKIAEIGPGSYFGEMSLFTGEPRSASVIARTDVECYRLDKASFQAVLKARPEIAEEISKLLAARRVALEAAQQSLSEEVRAQRIARSHGDLLERIERFFGLAGTAAR